MQKTIKIAWAILFPFCLLGGILLLGMFILPYDSAKLVANLFARDGNLESFSPERFTSLAWPLRVVGFLLLGLGGVMAAKPAAVQKRISLLISNICIKIHLLRQDSKEFLNDIRNIRVERSHLILLAVITLLGMLARVVFISQPMGHDESYTINAFAFAPLRDAISDYHMPNNHLFHTLLVYISHHLFGVQPWAVRLPVFLAGVLIIPACYFMTRYFFDSRSALLAAGLAAAYPRLIYYATTARGYSILMLLSIVTFILANYVRQNRNRAAWLLLVILSALGFYTVPVMLYPFGILLTWLLFSMLAKDVSPAYGQPSVFIRYLILAGISTGLLALFFYLPVICNFGLEMLIANKYVQPLTWDTYWINFKVRMIETWSEWVMDLPDPIILLGLLGIAASLVLHRRIARHRIPMLVTAFIWIIANLLILRPNPWAKLWTFFLPLVVIWAAAGLAGPVKELRLKFVNNIRLGSILVGAGLLAALAGTIIRSAYYLPEIAQPGKIEQSVIFLKNHLQEGDLVVVGEFDDAPLWYYSRLYDIPEESRDKKRPFYRTYVMVNSEFSQTLESVVEMRGPDLFFFKFDEASPVFQSGSITIYEMIPDLRLIKKVYDVK